MPTRRSPSSPISRRVRRRPSAAAAGCWSTAADYIRFERMILNGGTLDGARILLRRHDCADDAGIRLATVGVRALKTAQPDRSMDFTFIDDGKDKWGLGFLITTHVRWRASARPGSLSWGGIIQHLLLDRSGARHRGRRH